jgi:hypothetical protein|tara:strand:+ start:831 stop:1115 length:285 start_codon:yes stop_codon:yes gene_type:complete
MAKKKLKKISGALKKASAMHKAQAVAIDDMLKEGSMNTSGKMLLGGEMEDISVNTLIEKMTKGGDAKRNAKRADGSSSSQSYKMGGWTASKKKK